MKDRNIELLAPAGNRECLIAAVKSGADAVYFAGTMFGARSYADNFSDEEMKWAVDYCHIWGVKAYITVNTLVSDREIPQAMEYLKMLSEIGADAVIVQDLGICRLIKENFPNLSIHGSTQMTVHNIDGVLALEKMGISRVVLSRELSLDEIRDIKNKTQARLEVFAHGALCMCYSGQCLLSSVLGGRSGNRGKCAQPCRLEYKINDYGEKGFYMSLKDLCSLNHIREFKEIGVSSLKIEGRMKGSEYVSTVVGIYRKYIDSGASPTEEDVKKLDRIFFRGGLTDGYLIKKQGREMFCFDKPDNPYKKQEKAVLEEYDFKRRLKLNCKVKLNEGEYPQIEAEGNGISVLHKGEELLQESEKRPADEAFICEKISKTGGTPFVFDKIDVDIKGNPFISAKGVNELRREVLLKFEKAFSDSFRREDSYEIPKISPKDRENAEFVCRVVSFEQFQAVKKFEFSKITVPDYIIIDNYEEFLPIKEKIIIELPAILKKVPDSLKKLKNLGFDNLMAENIAFVNFEGFNLFGGQRMNVFNSYALKFLKEQGFKSAAISPELNLAGIRDLKKSVKTQVMVYGYQPLMVTENCVIRNKEKCSCHNEVNYLTDRKGIKLPVMRDGKECRSIILNSTPTYMGDKIDEIKRSGVEWLMLYFTVESPSLIEQICRRVFQGGKIEDYTRLHYNKGVL